MIEYILFGLVNNTENNITDIIPVIKESVPGGAMFRYIILKRNYKKKLTRFMVKNIKTTYNKSSDPYKNPVLLISVWDTDDLFLANIFSMLDMTYGKNIKYMYNYIIGG